MRYTIQALPQTLVKEDFVLFFHSTPTNPVSKSCLSQWYECEFWVSGVKYSTAEQYMMASKALLFNDINNFHDIMKAHTPQEFKHLGRQTKGFDGAVWNAHKDRIVIEGNIAKFSQNADLKAFLLSTGDKILVEASPYDKIWGIGIDEDNPDSINPSRWQGENHLGFALMAVRDVMRTWE